jgi:selenocysteine lyase/cysteine desulfurase
MALPCKRDEFDIPSDVTYLNCAFMGPLSHRVVQAGHEGLARKTQPWKITPEDFFTSIERLRELFAQLIGGDADGVALLPSVSYGTAIAASNLPLSRGQEIVVLAEQFPSNIYVWQDLAAQTGASLHTVPFPSDGDWTSMIIEAIHGSTRVVTVPNCHWTDGSAIDLVAVGARAREVGAALVVDGSQSIGALPFEVARAQPDFVVTGTYKWLLGPYSQAMMWVSPRFRSGRPIEHNWITRANSRDFSSIVNYTEELNPGARRYDVGEVSNFGLVPASLAALEQTLDWGVESIYSTIHPWIDALASGAERLDLGVPDAEHRSGHLLGLRLMGRDPRPLVSKLTEAKVFVSVRGDSIRVSPHVYNDASDIDRILELLEEFIRSAPVSGGSIAIKERS